MLRLPLFIGVATLLVAAGASGQDAAKFFDDNCAPCHTIGGSPDGGAPDLKDVTKRRDRRWLVRFILDPEDLVKKDADAAALVKQYDGVVMPETDGLTPRRAEELLTYIEAASAGTPPAAATAAPALAARAPTPQDVASGRDFYDGRRRLARNGPSCASCHAVTPVGALGGARLGPDLTLVQQRLGGARGLTAWLGNPPTRVMRGVFRNQPLTDEERFALVAMLGDAGAGQPPPATSWRTPRFVAAGSGAALLALAAMAAIWGRRLRAVRGPLVRRARGGSR